MADPVAQLAFIRPLPGKEDEVERHLLQLVDAAKVEDGTKVYVAHRRELEGGRVEFVFYELFSDSDALSVHGKNPALRAFAGQAAELLDGGITVEPLGIVAGKATALPV
ncbi:putative quinol monooxygenase [Amycolatopsis sp. H20-H5]|uniref:putative quinol monooxygenase n=1 Tax=Amycolatopsis sp. H20-H5 TaxID=3046309 RepID=UPI002DB6F5AB|nr:antibiotic biosynthesis monooxygenase [Amycolatopsis sp. H20-H5]MEC3979314.1 antibiotic biosynthesis monooxygenase [Amycolatopsis sp. H20-H5]